jgi:hypothetical protein
VDNFEDNRVENVHKASIDQAVVVDTWLTRWSQFIQQSPLSKIGVTEARSEMIQQVLEAMLRGESCISVAAEAVTALDDLVMDEQQAQQQKAPFVYDQQQLYLYRYWALEQSLAQQAARMIKGVENITVIDSFVVDKNDFLKAYKISRESGALYHDPAISGTVYQTEMGNKVLYGNQSTDGKMQLYSRIRLLDGWSEPEPLTSLNEQGNVNYPFLMSDGITLYYASDGEGSLGGYDIFVTRYDSENSNYLRPDNIGMPFNSPANDYMYAIDEFNNIGWFASDRYQPDNKVCIYVFVPNSSKEVYNYESTDEQIIINAASLRSIRTTWKDEEKVRTGKQRLAAIMYAKESGEQQKDFTLIIDDSAVYHTLNDFRSAEARKLYQQRIQKQKDYDNLKKNLDDKREQYAQGNSARKKNLTPAILELEKRTEQLLKEMAQLDISVRNEEIKKLKH